MIQDLNRIAAFLARRDVKAVKEPVDVLLLTGSCLFEPIRLAADLYGKGLARNLIVSGGIGHSTDYLRANVAAHPISGSTPVEGRAEAEIIADILRDFFGIPEASIIVECESTHCGANAELSKNMADRLGIVAKTLLLVQDPTMQRRTHASCERFWKGTGIVSFAPFVPRADEVAGEYFVTGEGEGIWSFDRFLSLIQGEISRLRDDENGYGPRGRNFIDHVEIPKEVLDSYEAVVTHLGSQDRNA